MNTWKRRALALLSVPLLALPSAGGVYLWLEPHIGPLLAGLTASGFELLYIGINVLIITTPELRRYARNVALAGVATAIIFNTLARYQMMVCVPLSAEQIANGVVSTCTLRNKAFDPLALGLAILESIPLAGLAYAMSVLLHRLSEAGITLRLLHPQHRAKLARSLRRLRTQAREAVRLGRELASSSAMLAQARADLEAARAMLRSQGEEFAQALLDAAPLEHELAQLRGDAARSAGDTARAMHDAETAYARESAALREVARLEAEAARLQAADARAVDLAARLEAETAQRARELREYEHVAAQLREELTIARAAGGLDLLAIARRFITAEVAVREIAPLLGLAESTLRSRLKAQTNGHAVEA